MERNSQVTPIKIKGFHIRNKDSGEWKDIALLNKRTPFKPTTPRKGGCPTIKERKEQRK